MLEMQTIMQTIISSNVKDAYGRFIFSDDIDLMKLPWDEQEEKENGDREG